MPDEDKTKKPDEKKPEGEQNESKKAPEGKSPDEKIAELEKKLGSMGEEWGQAKEFIQGASTVINTIAFNPELREQFQKAYQKDVVGKGEGTGEQREEGDQKKVVTDKSKGESEELSRTVKDVSVSQRERIIRDFESRYGIDKLKDEERKEARRQIENHFNQWGQSVKSAPLSVLDSQLDSSYIATHAEKLREEGKLEGLRTSRENALGTMGSFGGGAPSSSNEQGLTPKQKEWAKKLGVDEEKATKTYLAQDDEQTRKSPSEEKK